MPSFFQKAGGVKRQSPCRRPQTAKLQGVRGRSHCLSIRSKKFFVKLFSKKVCVNEVRRTETIKFPVNHNGRPMVAPTEIIYRTHVMYYTSGRVGKKFSILIKATKLPAAARRKFLPSFFQKAGGVKGRSPCRRPQTAKLHRGVGTESPPNHRLKKFFGKLFPKKAWATESRLMNFIVNINP